MPSCDLVGQAVVEVVVHLGHEVVVAQRRQDDLAIVSAVGAGVIRAGVIGQVVGRNVGHASGSSPMLCHDAEQYRIMEGSIC